MKLKKFCFGLIMVIDAQLGAVQRNDLQKKDFALSARLKNVASVCFALKADEMFKVVDEIDMRGDFNDRGGNFDEIFGIDSTTLIRCASDMRKTTILQEQCRHNRETYLACMDDIDFLDYQI